MTVRSKERPSQQRVQDMIKRFLIVVFKIVNVNIFLLKNASYGLTRMASLQDPESTVNDIKRNVTIYVLLIILRLKLNLSFSE